MSDAAQPGGIRTGGINREWAQVAAAVTDGYVYDAANPTIAARESGKVDETQFAEFDETHAVDSLTVTIAPGEAQVYGWVARDVSTDVDLDASTNGQVVYVGWDFQAVEEDKAIIGTASAFDKTTSDELPKLPLWSFDTDADGVTNADDLRDIDETVHAERTYTDEVRGRNGSTVGLGGETLDDVGGLTNSSGIVGTEELDADISPTWTSEHTFAAGLVVNEGQGVNDGDGIQRLGIDTGSTALKDEVGDNGFVAKDGSFVRAYAKSNTPFDIFDTEQSATAVQYDTDASAGVLRTPNASINLEGNGLTGVDNIEANDGLIRVFTTVGDGTGKIVFRDSSNANNNNMLALPEGGPVNFSERPANLRLATGQSIEDGSGVERIKIGGNQTRVKDDAGRDVIQASSGFDTFIKAYDGSDIQIFDEQGAFPALEYRPSASAPGTLDLTKANLIATGGIISAEYSGTVGTQGGSGVQLDENNSSTSLKIGFINGNGEEAHIFNNTGELQARDNAGNVTTLT